MIQSGLVWESILALGHPKRDVLLTKGLSSSVSECQIWKFLEVEADRGVRSGPHRGLEDRRPL